MKKSLATQSTERENIASSGSYSTGLALLVIHSPDIERSADFYRSLGLHLERHSHPPCGEHYATVDSACVFEIYPRPDGHPPSGAMTFGFRVSCVDRAVEQATKHCGTLKRKPESADWGRSAIVIDPDGNRVLLTEMPEPEAEVR